MNMIHKLISAAIALTILTGLVCGCLSGRNEAETNAPNAPSPVSVLPPVAPGMVDPGFRSKGWTIPLPPDAKQGRSRKHKMPGEDGKEYEVTFSDFDFKYGYIFTWEEADNPPTLDPIPKSKNWGLAQLTEISINKKVFMYKIKAYPKNNDSARFSLVYYLMNRDGDGTFETKPKSLTIPYWALEK